MIKKIITAICLIIISTSICFADEEKFGEGFYSDIRAYINNQYIESWNINNEIYINIEDLDLYGFDVKWNKELREYTAVFNNHIKYSNFMLMQKAQPLLMNLDDEWYIKWIKSTDPVFSATATSHGNIVEYTPISNGTIVIEFQRPIDVKYINKKYIPIFYGNIDISSKFDYKLNEEKNLLELTLNNYDFIQDHDYASHFKPRIDVIFLDGIRSNEGEILATPLRFSTYIKERLDNESIIKEKYVGNCYKTDIKAVVNNWDADVYRLDNKNLICIDRLGELIWDDKNRTIKVEVNERENLFGISEPIYEGKYKDWILKSPEMVMQKSQNGNNLVQISNRQNLIEIKFAKDILPECINRNYIKIYHGSSEQSSKFEYTYNEQENTLILELNNTSRDIITPFGYLFDNNKVDGMDNMEGRNYDIYILKGLRTKEGEKLPVTLRLTCGITWETKQ